MHRGSLGEGEAERIARNLARMYELGNWSWGESGRNTLANYLEAYLGVQGGKGSFWDSDYVIQYECDDEGLRVLERLK